jgi:hypothetical protein
MRLIHHLVSVLETLRPLDWSALSLSPDQLWQGPGQSAEQVVLTGFDFTHFAPTGSLSQTQPDVAEVQETMMVKGLSQLLYFLLTGQQAAQTSGPLAIDLKHRLPGLHPAFGKAIQQGIPAAEQTSGLKLAEWMNLLPSLHDLPAEVSSTQSTQLFPSNGNLRSQPEQSVIPPKYRPGTAPVVSTQVAQVPIDRTRHAAAVTAVTGFSQRSLALLGTSLVASLVGLGLGLHNRMQPNQLLSPGTLNPEQSFPPLSDWPGDEPGSFQEFLPRPNRPDYGESPSRPQPSSPVEADLVAPTEPTVAEPVAPGSESDTMAPFSTEWEGQNSESGIEGGENGQPAPEQPVDLAPEFPVESGPAPDRAPSPAPPPLEVKPAPQPIPAPAPPIPEAAPPPPLAPTAPPAAPAPTTTSSSGFSNQESPDTDKVAPFIGG